MRTSLASLTLPLALLSPAAAAAPPPQDLVDLVPQDAHLVVHAVADPELAFVEEYNWEILEAVRDARFDELVLDVMAAAKAPEQTIGEVRAARDMLVTLLGSVDWYALVENEVAFAQRVDRPAPPSLMPSMLFACRPDADRVAELERSLSLLMVTLAGLSEDNLIYQRHTPPKGRHGPNVYQLRVEPMGGRPLVQMAVLDDKVLLGIGDRFFDRSLALLSGEGGAALTSSERFRTAVGDLPAGCSQFSYVDMKGMLRGYRDGMVQLFREIGVSGTAISLVDDVHDLVSCVDTIAEAVHAEGTTVIKESWVRFDTGAEGARNPLLAGTRAGDTSRQLLEFVPADATSFKLGAGFDARPLYDWALERYQAYVPDAREHLIVWDGLQATLDMDVRDDVLSWAGSPSVRVTLPGRGSALEGDEWVSITLLDDHRAAKKVIGRFESIFEAVVPPVLEMLRERAGPGTPIPDFRIEGLDDPGGLRRLVVAMPVPLPIPPVIYGVRGRLLVSASSEQSLNHVLAAAAGEVPGLGEHPLLAGPTALPDTELVSASLVPWGRYMDQTRAALGTMRGILPSMIAGAQQGSGARGPEVQATSALVTGVLDRVLDILEHVDFLEHGVTYTVAREEGRVHYCHSATVMLSPSEREERRGMR